MTLSIARTVEVSYVGKRSDYKKMDEIANNDLDAWCRKIIDTSTPARRRLRDKLRRQARAKMKWRMRDEYEPDPNDAEFDR